MKKDLVEQELERQIADTHERYVTVMTSRVSEMPREQKERYFAMLSAVTVRLEDEKKPLRTVAQEAISEILPILVAEMQAN